MSRASKVLAIVRTDRTFERRDVRGEPCWVGRCIHCSSAIVVDAHGETAGTIEHIEPSTHGGTDEVSNLSLACARCNQRKGASLDRRRRDDPTLSAVIETLKARRRERWRDDPQAADAPTPETRGERGRRRGR
jgi:5-methylcytosine-specific restriction endonuclease McrA